MQTNEPLLYIDQPELTKPKVNMQTEFYTGKPQQLNRQQKENKRFIHCSLNEKIDYLLNLPHGVPQMKCEVITEQTFYRGKLIKEEEKTIWIEDMRRKRHFILKSDIKDILLISF